MDVESTEKLMRFTEQGIPSYGIVAPNAGMNGPLTLTGDNPAHFSPDVEACIRTEFEGLVAGDAIAIDTTTNAQ